MTGWALCLVLAAAPAQPPAPLEGSLRRALAGYPGAVSMGVLHADQTFFTAFGLADVKKQIPATPRTSYRMASITKAFTAVAVLQLVEQGKLGLDDEIQKSVPTFPRKSAPVTVRQLLGHLGGISHYRGLATERVTRPVTTAGALSLFKAWDLAAEPGTRFVYTSYGYNLLGAAIEGASGKSYADYLATNVFGLLGMKDSDIERPARADARWATGYALRQGALEPAARLELSSRLAGGGTRSTVEDLIAFARGLLDGALLSPQSHQLMRTAQVTRDGTIVDYGMGFSIFPQRGHYVVSHAGGQAGTTTLLVLIPAERFALALATNVEGQGALLSELSLGVQEELLDNGVRWRRAMAADPLDKVLHEGLSRIASYGLSHHSFLALDAPARDEAGLPAAFERVNRLLLSPEPELIAQAHHPRAGQPFIKVGVAMAAAIERVFGKQRLAEDRAEGPLPFFEDYLFACEQLECAEGLRFSQPLREKLHALSPSWERANARAVRTLKVGAAPDVKALQALLRPAFEGATVWPDLSDELRRAGRRETLRGRPVEGRALLELADELYGRAAP